MKVSRYLMLFCILLLVTKLPIYGFEQTFSFDLSDFTINNQNGVVQIIPNNASYVHGYNIVGAPDIPFFEYTFPTKEPLDLSTLSCEIISRSLVSTNVDIKCCEPHLSMGIDTDSFSTSKQVYSFYPDSLLKVYNGPSYNDHRVILAMAPFLYDYTTKNLYFVNQMKVSFDFSAIDSSIRQKESSRQVLDEVDYLIITHDSLVESFEKLSEWKNIKGVRTKIVTLNSIHEAIHGSSLVINEREIKEYIINYHRDHNISMVLLGGAPTIVPGQILTIEPDYLYPNTTISDLYYACFNENFSIYSGANPLEVDANDGIDYHPDINVSRLPVRNRAQLEAYIQKLLKYERNPEMDCDSIHMLWSGVCSHWIDSTTMMSDAQYESEMLSEEFSDSFPMVSNRYFFDTMNNLGLSGSDAIVDANNLSNVINTYQPHWLNMYCHGDFDRWCLDSIPFTNEYASALENSRQPMIITTLACLTADFSHNSHPCLAESMLFNPEGGALVYWGSSNNGKGGYPYQFSPSSDICWRFWKDLLSNNHYGEAVKLVRNEYAELPEADSHRLSMSMNALGDCEVPIYTDVPHLFQDLELRIAYDAVYFSGCCLDSCCRVAISSQGDNASRYFVVEKGDTGQVLLSNLIPCNVCFTKKNHVPFLTVTGHFFQDDGTHHLYLQNASYSGNTILYEAPGNIFVGQNVDSSIEHGDVVVESGGSLRFMADNSTVIQSGFRCKQGGKTIIY